MTEIRQQTTDDKRQTMKKYNVEKYRPEIKVLETDFWLRMTDPFRLATKEERKTTDDKKKMTNDGKNTM